MLKIKTVQSIDLQDWDALVKETYGRMYSFQQQNDCRERGIYNITVPDIEAFDYQNDSIPEKVNGDERGVSFAAWLARDPQQKLGSADEWDRNHGLCLFWERNFYPSNEVLANDLHDRGLLPAGEYQLVIDW